MICNECYNKPICVIYADIMKHAGSAEVSINTCNYRKWIYESYRKDEKFERVETVKKEIDPFTGKPKVDRDKINELSKRKSQEKKLAAKEAKKDEEKKPKTKVEPVAIPLVLDHTCPGCGGTTFKSDASKCDKCGSDICSCCATVNGDNNEILCPKCWAEL